MLIIPCSRVPVGRARVSVYSCDAPTVIVSVFLEPRKRSGLLQKIMSKRENPVGNRRALATFPT